MAEKKKRVWCTLKQKMEALDRLNKGESLQKIAKYLGVGNSTIKDWRKN
jgi:transposase